MMGSGVRVTYAAPFSNHSARLGRDGFRGAGGSAPGYDPSDLRVRVKGSFIGLARRGGDMEIAGLFQLLGEQLLAFGRGGQKEREALGDAGANGLHTGREQG